MTSERPELRLRRRGVTLGLLTFLLGCQRRSEAATALPLSPPDVGTPSPPPPPDAGTRGSTRLLDWTFDGAVSTKTAVVVPIWGGTDARFPVLVALHGRGEARKPPAEGALGWPRDYALLRAIARVAAPPLQPVDFEGFVDAQRLSALNQQLATRSFGGLIVACPYVPDLDLADEAAVAAFGAFLTDVLLPRIRRETPARAEASATGIDGVSLGGALSLAIGLGSPLAFGAVGALQPALDAADATRWATRAKGARTVNPGLALRLLTSDGDHFREAVRRTSSAFHDAGIAHDFELVVGPHDYPFNRGPGSIEMLLWHDRTLARG
jgi:iron(III)-salmochelin esterase